MWLALKQVGSSCYAQDCLNHLEWYSGAPFDYLPEGQSLYAHESAACLRVRIDPQHPNRLQFNYHNWNGCHGTRKVEAICEYKLREYSWLKKPEIL